MPRRDDIKKVMIIGSGPIIIGQACKALRKLGNEIVLVNSNPATIMHDPGMAGATYIEPLNLEGMARVIDIVIHRDQAVGVQTAGNKAGVKDV